MTIKSPYNFVPLSENVYFPEWADKVSHDVPFSDGLSGEIEIELETVTPTFIRDSEKLTDFFNSKTPHIPVPLNVIPGTSLKGVIRNVVEIASFGKMNQIDNRKFSWRDLRNRTYSAKFTQSFATEPKVQAGFIQQEGEHWYLIPAKMARIEQCELHNDFGVKSNLLSAVDKYNFWKQKGKSLKNKFKITEPSTNVFIKQCGKFRRAQFSNNGTLGTLVFTGQIRARRQGREGYHGKFNKHLEFVFFEPNYNNKILIDKQMRRDFELNHSETRNIDNHKLALAPNDEWDFWKSKLSEGKLMPVFWLPQNNNAIEAFGLAMLFRLPYKYSTIDLLPPNHKQNSFDLADIIFGTVNNKQALKGRVHFGHLIETIPSANKRRKLREVTKILGSPRPTFYPYYLKQTTNSNNKVNSYITYMDKNAEIKGWKRYPSENITPNMQSCEKVDSSTTFKPIDRGAKFKGKIRFHNLKQEELGALLWALTFGNNENCQHKIGMAKPLGFGRVKLEIKNINLLYSEEITNNIDNFVNTFKTHMSQHISNWDSSPQILNLIAMADITKSPSYIGIEYPKLGIGNGQIDEFAHIKRNKLALPDYILTKKSIYSPKAQTIQNAVEQDIEQIIKMSLQDFEKYLKTCQDNTIFEVYNNLSKNNKKRKIINRALIERKGPIWKNLDKIMKKYKKSF